MAMEWKNLLDFSRIGPGGVKSGSTREDLDKGYRTDFEKDFDRIVYSEPFRRLQNKTQVHSLPRSEHVRNRLTHSLEASTIARSLGRRVGYEILKNYKNQVEEEDEKDFPSLIAECARAATLAHDIGNPPFGHSGEEAIQEWFRDRGKKKLGGEWDGVSAKLSGADIADLQYFDGNPQGFRILTHYPHGLENENGEYEGLRLTKMFPRQICCPRPDRKIRKSRYFSNGNRNFQGSGASTRAPRISPEQRQFLPFCVVAAPNFLPGRGC